MRCYGSPFLSLFASACLYTASRVISEIQSGWGGVILSACLSNGTFTKSDAKTGFFPNKKTFHTSEQKTIYTIQPCVIKKTENDYVRR